MSWNLRSIGAAIPPRPFSGAATPHVPDIGDARTWHGNYHDAHKADATDLWVAFVSELLNDVREELLRAFTTPPPPDPLPWWSKKEPPVRLDATRVLFSDECDDILDNIGLDPSAVRRAWVDRAIDDLTTRNSVAPRSIRRAVA